MYAITNKITEYLRKAISNNIPQGMPSITYQKLTGKKVHRRVCAIHLSCTFICPKTFMMLLGCVRTGNTII